MQQYVHAGFSSTVRRAALALAACGAIAAPSAHAMPAKSLIVVPPAQLPALARQGGDAMFLHDTVDGATLLYVEHSQAGQLAIFDVTDPSRVKATGTVQLDAPGPFDFVGALGENAELLRFRAGQGNALLDLHRAKSPTLRQVDGQTVQGQTVALGGDGFTVSAPADGGMQPSRDYQVVDTGAAAALEQVVDVKQVRAQIAKADTGTTFLLTDGGLYLIRRPAVEMDKQQRDLDYPD